ncbi:MAG: hypothetical protein A2381_10975 [Bdellovibrionales bacterium RIFOXYB1_FULL_37_110]|nr:MAG: hypothetical protein A2181_07115 [Bdellovibrionales bacterium RIFOXYA1_FULL_38_20]OFZ51187.1 MAG: hypothetical protein A2417_17960 [Bdellovibrionales bacterium RIFOXYC1_FULL_37_79]OFZ61293.1 MAG: hypothetical protein A2381_10975 [Bdellovibrionales bacterium RIFOXYB1_FULL_37_110]OFZ62156.1 MAG: hypothetical protein A2577_14550 [Bdellovibrionales bacterium RIFOXYD1_FULL_36_51]
MSKFKNITLVLKPNIIEDFTQFLPDLITYLLNQKATVHFFNFEKERLKGLACDLLSQISFIEKTDLNHISDLVIVLGGDGTLIGFCRDVGKMSAPIFGINLGKLGFLTEFSKNDFMDELGNVLNGKYQTRIMKPHFASVYNKENQETFNGFFFNDMVVSNDSIARIIRISIFINNEHLFNVDGDGLIVSTSQGSTAYSLSAGGPIIHPSVKALVLTPVCAHTLNSRPIVVPEDTIIQTAIFEDSNNVVLTLDGQLAFSLKKTDVVKTHNPKHPGFQIIINPKRTYLSNLRDKFIQGNRL